MKVHIFILLILSELCLTYKVIIFNPAFGASRSNFLGKIADILIDAGHEVTMLIPVFVEGNKHLVGTNKVKNIIRIDQDPRILQIHKEGAMEEFLRKKFWKMGAEITSVLPLIGNFSKTAAYQVEYIFQQKDLLHNLRQEMFDLTITESFFLVAFALFDEIGVRSVINADSMLYVKGMKEALGEPTAVAYYPGLFSPINDKMNFFGRVVNFVIHQMEYLFTVLRYNAEIMALPDTYKGSRDWRDLLSRVAFNFVNSNQYIDYASPTLPKTVFIGGMQVNTKKSGKATLTKEWDDVLARRKTNILVSFGSIAHSADMPNEFKNAFLEVFSSMPDTTFIWKYEEANATLADHLPNVKLTTWMPQNDLLADDRLNLFVTHGGLGSSMELAFQGKPAVIIPLMTDQPRNAHMLARHGGALQLDKTLLHNPDEIKRAIQTVLNNTDYKKNAVRLAKILGEQPYNPKDTVLKHCNFAVQFGPLEALNSEGRHLNAFQYSSFDIITVVLIILAIISSAAYFLIRAILRQAKKGFMNLKQKSE